MYIVLSAFDIMDDIVDARRCAEAIKGRMITLMSLQIEDGS